MPSTMLLDDYQQQIQDELKQHAQQAFQSAQQAVQPIQQAVAPPQLSVPAAPDLGAVQDQLSQYAQQVSQPVQQASSAAINFANPQPQQGVIPLDQSGKSVQQQLQDYAAEKTQGIIHLGGPQTPPVLGPVPQDQTDQTQVLGGTAPSTPAPTQPSSSATTAAATGNAPVDPTSPTTFARTIAPYAAEAARQLGLPADQGAAWITAMAANETGFGKALPDPGSNNFFGIKAHPGVKSGASVATTEGAGAAAHTEQANFAVYDSPADAIRDYVGIIQRNQPATVGAQTLEAFNAGLKAGGYYTADPQQYLHNLQGLTRQVQGDVSSALSTTNVAPEGSTVPVQPVATTTTAALPATLPSNNLAVTPSSRAVAGDSTAMNQSQFGDSQLTTAESYAACGPAAAVRFAEKMGRNPTLREATDMAAQVGWTSGGGMAGIQSEQKLMTNLGVPTHVVQGPQWSQFAAEAQSGNPVTISTSAHYFYADGYDPSSGAFHVGRSGLDLRGGKEWMTPQDMTAAATRLGGGEVQGALFADNPTVPGSSQAQTASNSQSQTLTMGGNEPADLRTMTPQRNRPPLVAQTPSTALPQPQPQASDILGGIGQGLGAAQQAAAQIESNAQSAAQQAGQNAIAAAQQALDQAHQAADQARQVAQQVVTPALGAVQQAPQQVQQASQQVLGAVQQAPQQAQRAVQSTVQDLQQAGAPVLGSAPVQAAGQALGAVTQQARQLPSELVQQGVSAASETLSSPQNLARTALETALPVQQVQAGLESDARIGQLTTDRVISQAKQAGWEPDPHSEQIVRAVLQTVTPLNLASMLIPGAGEATGGARVLQVAKALGLVGAGAGLGEAAAPYLPEPIQPYAQTIGGVGLPLGVGGLERLAARLPGAAERVLARAPTAALTRAGEEAPIRAQAPVAEEAAAAPIEGGVNPEVVHTFDPAAPQVAGWQIHDIPTDARAGLLNDLGDAGVAHQVLSDGSVRVNALPVANARYEQAIAQAVKSAGAKIRRVNGTAEYQPTLGAAGEGLGATELGGVPGPEQRVVRPELGAGAAVGAEPVAATAFRAPGAQRGEPAAGFTAPAAQTGAGARIRDFFSGESSEAGGVNPQVALRLGGAVGGGLAGVATTPTSEGEDPNTILRDRVLRGLAGAGAGLALTSAVAGYRGQVGQAELEGIRAGGLGPTTRTPPRPAPNTPAYQQWLTNTGPWAPAAARGPVAQAVDLTKQSILSNPATHIANVIGNTIELLRQPINLAAGGRGDDALAGLVSVARGVPEAGRNALQALRGRQLPTLGGGAGSVIPARAPIFRALSAADAFTRTLGEYQGMAAESSRMLRDAGISPHDPYAATYLANHAAELQAAGARGGAQSVFARIRGAPEGETFVDHVFGNFSRAKEGLLASPRLRDQALGALLDLSIPFSGVPVQMLKIGANRLPVAAQVSGGLRMLGDLRAGNMAAFQQHMGETMVESTIQLMVAKQIADGNITGASDPDHPDSINMPGVGWVSMNELGAYTLPMRIMASWADGYEKGGEKVTKDTPALQAALDRHGAALNAAIKPLAQGVPGENLIRLLSNMEQGGPGQGALSIGQDVVNRVASPGALRFANNLLDPVARDVDRKGVDSLWKGPASNIPGLANLVPPRIDPTTGEVLGKTRTGLGTLIGVQQTTSSPITREVDRLKQAGYTRLALPNPSGTVSVGGSQIPLSQDEQRQVTAITGKALGSFADKLDTPGYKNSSDDRKALIMKSYLDAAAKSDARATLQVLGRAELTKRIVDNRTTVGQLNDLAGGGGLLPEDFSFDPTSGLSVLEQRRQQLGGAAA